MSVVKKPWILAVLLGALLLGGCGLSLAGDVTPPPNYRPPATFANPAAQAGQPADQQQAAAAQAVFPLVPPDPAQGASIFAEKCIPCHGEQGMGNGPQAAQLPNPPAAIGSAEVARKSRPVDWFQVVTAGKFDKFMPGFSGSLNDRQRWDVLAYVYTLSAGPDVLAQGKPLYEQNCAECHGAKGNGDGSKAASLKTKPPAWSDQSLLANLSEDDMAALIASGKGEMPAFGDRLNEEQRTTLASYIRVLSFASAGNNAESASAGNTIPSVATGTPAAQGTPQAAANETAPVGTPALETPAAGTAVAAKKIQITGQVTNGTKGGKLPEKMKVELDAFNGMNPAFNLSTDAAPDGSYIFKDVQFNPDYVYLVRVDVNGISFNSDILHGTDVVSEQAVLPVQVYDTTTDASGLVMDRMHLFFDFSTPGLVQVVNLYIFSNNSEKVLVPAEKDKPVVQIELPQGATNLQFQDGQLGQRYVQTANGFGDTAEVIPGPGQHQILFAYDLPYNNKLNLSVKAPVDTSAAIVMVPPVGVNLKSSQLQDAGQRDMSGVSFRMYQAVSSLKAGETLSLALSGKAGQASSENSSLNTLLIGVGAFGLALIGAGYWLYRSRRTPSPAADGSEPGAFLQDGEAGAAMGSEAETSESLLEAILALDDLHASGKLPDPAYQERRAGLKTRLGDALQREKGG